MGMYLVPMSIEMNYVSSTRPGLAGSIEAPVTILGDANLTIFDASLFFIGYDGYISAPQGIFPPPILSQL